MRGSNSSAFLRMASEITLSAFLGVIAVFLEPMENSRNGKLQSIVLRQVILVASEATVFYT